MLNPNGYKDLLIISSEGKIIYSDFSNVSFMKLKDEKINGRHLTDVFTNIQNDYPLLDAAQNGKANSSYNAEIRTCTGKTFRKSACAYPIYREGKPAAALEFSNIRYGRGDIRDIETSTDNAKFRGNGTVYSVDNIITENENMILLKKEVEKIALTEFPVLICGETGTGKELVAQAIHNSSRRFNKPFIAVNCGTIPENLAESMLFGTTKGSFTDSEDKAGLFEQAEGGTLFLDEMNSLSMQMQVKLLRAVERKIIRRIGDTKERKVDVRIIAATNENPELLISQKRILQDFYHRVAASVILLPGLKDRGDDVIVLANYYIDYFNSMMNMKVNHLGEDIAELFRQYSWPGNIRELRNVIEGAFAFNESSDISVSDIPMYIMESIHTGGDPHASAKGNTADFRNLTGRLGAIEDEIIKTAMRENGYSLTAAAKELGISKQLLKYKIDARKRKDGNE